MTQIRKINLNQDFSDNPQLSEVASVSLKLVSELGKEEDSVRNKIAENYNEMVLKILKAMEA